MMTVVFLYGCAETPEEEKLGNIHGTVTDKATGELIRSAGVTLNPGGRKAVTGNDGQYEFTDLKTGEYTLQVTKTGYTDLLNHKIIVAAGKNNPSSIQMEKLPPSLRIVDDSEQNINELDFGSAEADLTRSFNIFNNGPESIEWEITITAKWITGVSKASGKLNAGATQAIVVTIDREKLDGDENTTTIQVTSDNGSRQLTVKAIGEVRILATLNTLAVTNITTTTTMLNSEILTEGIPTYTERGFVYSFSPMPTLETTIVKVTASRTENKTYSAIANGLTLGQTYYVRAYVINKAGTAYSSNEVSFKPEMVLPEVTTKTVSNVNATTATLNGSIENIGDPAYTERGFVYSTTRNPSVEDASKKIVIGSGTGNFSINIMDLTEGTTYYVRAYAINMKGTVYGIEVALTPQTLQYVELLSANIMVQKVDITSGNINWTSAKSLCENSTIGGYTDWRLPTLDELTAMYNNSSIVGGFITTPETVLDRLEHNFWSGDPMYYYYTYYTCYWTNTVQNGSLYYLIDFSDGSTQSVSSNSSVGFRNFVSGIWTGDVYRQYDNYYRNRARAVRTLP